MIKYQEIFWQQVWVAKHTLCFIERLDEDKGVAAAYDVCHRLMTPCVAAYRLQQGFWQLVDSRFVIFCVDLFNKSDIHDKIGNFQWVLDWGGSVAAAYGPLFSRLVLLGLNFDSSATCGFTFWAKHWSLKRKGQTNKRRIVGVLLRRLVPLVQPPCAPYAAVYWPKFWQHCNMWVCFCFDW